MKRQFVFAAAVLVLLPSLAWSAGFALFEAGNKALGMGGAFTAVADDPSAQFWNPAGMAFQIDEGYQLMTGVTFITPRQDFSGSAPYPGEGYTASQESQTFYPPHLYLAMPISPKVNVAVGVYTPFGLGTWWENEDTFAGRFLSKKADLEVIDLGGQVSWAISENFAIGGGIDYMIGKIELHKNAALINPYTQSLVDVAEVKLATDGLGNNTWAWNAGFLAKLGGGFSIGGMYRSDFDVKGTSAYASFTQISTGYPDFDAVVAGTIPFDEDPKVTTVLNFPDFWQVGLAWSNEKFTLSGQYGEMGWSSFAELAIEFPDYPYLNSTVREAYQDAKQYRFGFDWRASQRLSLRLGYGFDETPQPDESLSPLLADGDRDFYSIGFGFVSRNNRWGLDVGYEYLELADRSTGGRSFDGFDGSFHDSGAHLFGASLIYKF